MNQGTFTNLAGDAVAATGDGDVVITNSGDISTSGIFSRGIDTRLSANGSASTTIANTGDITTSGGSTFYLYGSRAISANSYGFGDVSVYNSGLLTATGQFSRGIHAFALLGTANIDVDNIGAISTSGDDAEGIQVFHYSSGIATITNTATISTVGAKSSGIQVNQDTFTNVSGTYLAATGDGNVVINNSGDISTAGAFSRGIDTRLYVAGTASHDDYKHW